MKHSFACWAGEYRYFRTGIGESSSRLEVWLSGNAQIYNNFRRFVRNVNLKISLPLDRCRGLRADIIDDSRNAFYFIGNSAGNRCEKIMREARPVRSHAVHATDGAEGADIIVRALIAHHADRLHRKQDDECLPCRVIKIRGAKLFDEDRVGVAQQIELFLRDVADDADGKPRSGKRMTVDEMLRNPERPADSADFIFE